MLQSLNKNSRILVVDDDPEARQHLTLCVLAKLLPSMDKLVLYDNLDAFSSKYHLHGFQSSRGNASVKYLGSTESLRLDPIPTPSQFNVLVELSPQAVEEYCFMPRSQNQYLSEDPNVV